MNAAETLVAAGALILDPVRWSQGAWSRDSNGKPTSCFSEYAAAWSATGALSKVTESSSWIPARHFLSLAADMLYGETASQVNDTQGHKAVMKIYAKAIELANRQ